MLFREIKKYFSLYIIVALTATMANAQVIEDGQLIDMKIYFPYDDARIAPTYMENQQSLHIIDSLLNNTDYISTISKIEIMAQSSPEGKIEHNEQLSKQRQKSLESYFTTNYPAINPSLWAFDSMAENWELFHQHLVDDPNIPHRDEVLAISNGDRDPDAKEWLIKKIDGGKSWQYIKEHILPTQRFGASVLFIPTKEPTPIIEPTPEPEVIQEDEPEEELEEEPAQYVAPKPEPTPNEPKNPKTLVALKTNLLLDVVTAVNLAAEVPIGNRFSVVGEVIYPWWRNWDNNFTMQIESYHGEVKYWLGERTQENRLTGWSAGLYGGWGRYDLQPFSEEGVQGDFYDVGAMISYSHSIARNLNLEYTLGLGYLSTKYNDYYMAYDTEKYGDIKVIPYPWMNNTLRTVLPTRIGVSLIWLINSKGEGGRR